MIVTSRNVEFLMGWGEDIERGVTSFVVVFVVVVVPMVFLLLKREEGDNLEGLIIRDPGRVRRVIMVGIIDIFFVGVRLGEQGDWDC